MVNGHGGGKGGQDRGGRVYCRTRTGGEGGGIGEGVICMWDKLRWYNGLVLIGRGDIIRLRRRKELEYNDCMVGVV